ncbi:MAG: hypothetical protein ACP5D2_03455 [Candidatus Nanoarchaeia archaeon]
MPRTSYNAGHSHSWKRGGRYTSYDKGHRHVLVHKLKVALPARPGEHSHKLLGG